MAETADDTVVHLGAITPDPTVEEVAAIAAAIETAWPRPFVAEPAVEASRWRFSGRWWSKPLPSRRDRP
jgi:hypothetical protein